MGDPQPFASSLKGWRLKIFDTDKHGEDFPERFEAVVAEK
jgi:hypothetical protein